MRSKKISRPKVKKFVEDCLASGITSPSEMKEAYKNKWKKDLSAEAFINAMRRLGVSSEQRKQLAEEAQKQTAVKDISEYRQVQNYSTRSETKITIEQRQRQLQNMRKLWEIMGYSNPEEWEEAAILEKLKTVYPLVKDERGRMRFEHPSIVGQLLSALNTIFPSILTKGWYSDYTRKAGELKDFFSFQEYSEFVKSQFNLMYQCLFDLQVNMGCREGSKQHTGILSLLWENIDYDKRRCSIRDKGGRGDSARLWKNVPLDLFPWLHGWTKLLEWHRQQFGYSPTNEQHGTGRVFPVSYQSYLEAFHNARGKCNGRIAGDSETLRPHIIRRTHAQWLVKLKVPLERICGQFPNGRYGVGWDNPAILLKYYVELEDDPELENKINQQMQTLGLVSPQSPQEEPITPMLAT